MKRKYTDFEFENKVQLYKHAFGEEINGELLEKIVSTFEIKSVQRIMSRASALSMGWVSLDEKNACGCVCEENTIYVDLSRPVGCSIVLVTASQNFERKKVQKMFKEHYRYRRNFLRKHDHLHHEKSYYLGIAGVRVTALAALCRCGPILRVVGRNVSRRLLHG